MKHYRRVGSQKGSQPFFIHKLKNKCGEQGFLFLKEKTYL